MSNLAVIGGAESFRMIQDSHLTAESLGVQETPFGPSQPIHKVQAEALTFLFMNRHGDQGYTTNSASVNYRANLYALKDQGTANILSWTGCGSIAEGFPTGSLAILEDVIDETRNRNRTFFPKSSIGFLRQNPLFCPRLHDHLHNAVTAEAQSVRVGGVYVCTDGPRLETVAEIRKYQSYGAELVGTSLAPEVFLARELELCYISLGVIMNRA
ncbi:MAG: MTAP family purine nucleoside phosphorylase, partial [Planctomycetota bacterium]